MITWRRKKFVCPRRVKNADGRIICLAFFAAAEIQRFASAPPPSAGSCSRAGCVRVMALRYVSQLCASSPPRTSVEPGSVSVRASGRGASTASDRCGASLSRLRHPRSTGACGSPRAATASIHVSHIRLAGQQCRGRCLPCGTACGASVCQLCWSAAERERGRSLGGCDRACRCGHGVQRRELRG